jgi:hypothetical protein
MPNGMGCRFAVNRAGVAVNVDGLAPEPMVW